MVEVTRASHRILLPQDLGIVSGHHDVPPILHHSGEPIFVHCRPAWRDFEPFSCRDGGINSAYVRHHRRYVTWGRGHWILVCFRTRWSSLCIHLLHLNINLYFRRRLQQLKKFAEQLGDVRNFIRDRRARDLFYQLVLSGSVSLEKSVTSHL